MPLSFPKSPDTEAQLDLLRQRHTLLNEIIERLEVYQSSQGIIALFQAVEPPVLVRQSLSEAQSR